MFRGWRERTSAKKSPQVLLDVHPVNSCALTSALLPTAARSVSGLVIIADNVRARVCVCVCVCDVLRHSRTPVLRQRVVIRVVEYSATGPARTAEQSTGIVLSSAA